MPIKLAQISPFDYCNNKCFYCPVRYYQQPTDYMIHMEPELFEKIIKELIDNKGGLVDPNFNFIYTAQYNEILLYKYLKEMLDILRRYGIQTYILSNGVACTQDKLDLVKQYKDVVTGVNFNIPSFKAEEWAEETGNKPELMAQVISNVMNVYSEFGAGASVVMNGVGNMSQRLEHAKSLFTGLNIYSNSGLCDRAGLLVGKTSIDNTAEIERNKAGKSKVIGCRNGNRHNEWLHVNAKGKAFACCNDYFYQYEFGDFNNQSLKEIWADKDEALDKAKSDLCAKCAFAVWE